MLSKFFLITVFIIKFDKKTAHTPFVLFEKIYYQVWQTGKVLRISKPLLQSVTCDKKLLQNMSVLRSVTRVITYKLWQVIQYDNYYKGRRNRTWPDFFYTSYIYKGEVSSKM